MPTSRDDPDIHPDDPDIHHALGPVLRGETTTIHGRDAKPGDPYTEHFRLRHSVYVLWRRLHEPRTAAEKLAKYTAVHRATLEELEAELKELSSG